MDTDVLSPAEQIFIFDTTLRDGEPKPVFLDRLKKAVEELRSA